MKNAKIKWIFFDVGSTIVDETLCHVRRFDAIEDEMKEKFGRRLSYEDELLPLIIKGAKARTGYSPVRYACDVLGLTFPLYPREYERPFPDAIPTLSALKTDYKLGIIANQPKELEGALDEMGFSGLFERVFGSDDFGMEKPDPRFFEFALCECGCAPREAVMIGDRIDNDVTPAKAVGMRTVWVRRGFFGQDMPRNDAEISDAEADSLFELPDILRRLSGGEE